MAKTSSTSSAPPAPPAEPEPVPGPAELRRDLEQRFPPPAPPPPAEPAPATPGAEGGADDELSAGLEALADQPAKLSELNEEEIADLVELGFGLVAEGRGAHWEIQRRRALRIGKWAKKTIDRYGGVPESWGKHIPALILCAILAIEIKGRLDEDGRLAKPHLEEERTS